MTQLNDEELVAVRGMLADYGGALANVPAWGGIAADARVHSSLGQFTTDMDVVRAISFSHFPSGILQAVLWPAGSRSRRTRLRQTWS